MFSLAARGLKPRFLFRSHSNWSQIKKHKAEVDLKKGRERTKLSVAITKAVKADGTDPLLNGWLARLLDDARRISMPKSAIDVAIERANRAKTGQNVIFEGRYGTIFFLIECITDKPQRTVQPLRKIFKDYDGVLSETANQVKWMFKQRGSVEVVAPLLPTDIAKLEKSLIYLQSENQRIIRGASADKVEEELDYSRLDPIEPSSIPLDALAERAIEFDAEDIQLLSIDPREQIESKKLPLLYSPDFDANIDWIKAFPRIKGLQFQCSFGTLQKLSLGMESMRYYGLKPILRSTRHIWIPNSDTYADDSIWQNLPDADMPPNENGQRPLDQVLSLLQGIREMDDVVEVWHNIRGVEPWDELSHCRSSEDESSRAVM